MRSFALWKRSDCRGSKEQLVPSRLFLTNTGSLYYSGEAQAHRHHHTASSPQDAGLARKTRGKEEKEEKGKIECTHWHLVEGQWETAAISSHCTFQTHLWRAVAFGAKDAGANCLWWCGRGGRRGRRPDEGQPGRSRRGVMREEIKWSGGVREGESEMDSDGREGREREI